MGWTSRDEVLGRHDARVVTGGVFRGFAMVRGRAAAVWRWQGSGVAIEPFAPLAPDVARALEVDAVAVQRFLRR